MSGLHAKWMCWGLQVVVTLAVRTGAAAETSSEPFLVLDSGGHTAIVHAIVFTPDGKELISVADDKTIRFWDVESGDPLRTWRPPIGRGPVGKLYAAACSPDGGTLAVGGWGIDKNRVGSIYLISIPTGQVQRVLEGHEYVVSDLAFSPDGRQLASVGQDQTARLWDVRTGKCRQVLEGHGDHVYGVAFSPDGRRLATAGDDQTARIWSVATGRTETVLEGHEGLVRAIAWSPDGQTVATGGYDGSIRLWDPDGTPRNRFADLGGFVEALTFTADSRSLLFTLCGDQPGAHLLDLTTGRPRVRFTRHDNSVCDGVLSPDGTLAASAGGKAHEIYVWKTSDGSQVHRLAGGGRTVFSCGWSTEGQTIAWGNTFRRASDNDFGPLERAFRLPELEFADPPDEGFTRARPDRGSLSLEATDEYHLDINQSGRAWKTLTSDESTSGRILSFTLVSGDRIVGGADFGLWLVDPVKAQQLRDFEGHTGGVWAVAPSPDDRYFLSASADQTLRIWDLTREEPLVSLFFAGDEWVVWTPEGYYAASPGGERLMGWHVNNGPHEMASFYPAGRFRQSLYRPDVIKLLLQAGGTERALALAGRETPTRVEQVLPPLAAITWPDRSELEVTQPTLEVRAVARPAGEDPLTSMWLLVDGRPYQGRLSQRDLATVQVEGEQVRQSWTVELTPGTHQIVVKASTARSYGLSEPVDVVYSPQKLELPTLYVLAVGISDYSKEAWQLQFGAKDARAAAEVFQQASRPLFRQVQVKVLVDAEATRRGILRGLEWLKGQMTQRDVGVFFYAGHGVRDEQGVFFLFPFDGEPKELGFSCVSEEEIKRYCQATPGRLMLLLDACHAGSLGGDRRRSLESLTDDLIRDLLTDDYGVIVMAASMGRERSAEVSTWGHGAFTKALIEGLKGKADFNEDKTIYLNELDLYVTDRVKELTDGRQHPVTQKPTSIRSFPLARP